MKAPAQSVVFDGCALAVEPGGEDQLVASGGRLCGELIEAIEDVLGRRSWVDHVIVVDMGASGSDVAPYQQTVKLRIPGSSSTTSTDAVRVVADRDGAEYCGVDCSAMTRLPGWACMTSSGHFVPVATGIGKY